MPLEVYILCLVFPILEKNILKGLNLEFGSLFCLFKSRLIYFCICANMSIFFLLCVTEFPKIVAAQMVLSHFLSVL